MTKDSFIDFITEPNDPQLFNYLKENYPASKTWEILFSAVKWETKNIFKREFDILYNKCFKTLKNISVSEFTNSEKSIAQKWTNYMLTRELEALMIFLYISSEDFNESNIIIKGKGFLDNCLKQKNGIVFTSPHYGAFNSLPIVLAKLGIPQMALSGDESNHLTKIKNTFVPELSDTIHEVVSVTSITAYRKALRSLKKKINVVIFPEYTIGDPPRFSVNYFGRNIPAAMGAERMAKRSSSPILPCTLIREDTNKPIYTLEFFEPIIDGLQDNGSATLRIHKWIENVVRKRPEFWSYWDTFEEKIKYENKAKV